MAKDKGEGGGRRIAQNRRALHDYTIIERFEAGLMLAGTEVKSLRAGQVSINESYAGEKGGELFLFNAYIAPYGAGKTFGHEPRRPRKLLMHRREIDKVVGRVHRERMTLIPLSLFFNARGLAKVDLALAQGKRKVDMRATIKEREWQREKARVLRARN